MKLIIKLNLKDVKISKQLKYIDNTKNELQKFGLHSYLHIATCKENRSSIRKPIKCLSIEVIQSQHYLLREISSKI